MDNYSQMFGKYLGQFQQPQGGQFQQPQQYQQFQQMQAPQLGPTMNAGQGANAFTVSPTQSAPAPEKAAGDKLIGLFSLLGQGGQLSPMSLPSVNSPDPNQKPYYSGR